MGQIIQVPGTFENIIDGKLANAEQIYDATEGKSQSAINAKVKEDVEAAEGDISNLQTAVADTYNKSAIDTALSAKQDSISDLATIRSGASAGATAVQPAAMETALADKQDTIADLATIRSGASAGATAVQPAALEAEVSRAQAAELTKANAADVYTKTEVNGMVSTPHQNYVTVADYASLPAVADGQPDTIYRVANYDGAYNSGAGRVDATKYTEYAYSNNALILLSVKSAVGEVFDISEYNSNAIYNSLTEALGSNGANVPADNQRGGMSVKFVKRINYAIYTVTVVSNQDSSQVPGWGDSGNIDINEPLIEGNNITAEAIVANLDTTVVADHSEKGDALAAIQALALNGTAKFQYTDTYTPEDQQVGIPVYTLYTVTKTTNEATEYVQYRLMSTAWSTDTENWTIADEGVYVENPEFVYVKTDAEDKILWAIRTDGDIFYGAGVPQQVIDYIEERISLDEYEDIVAFLNGLEEGDKTLQTLLNEKVDKEEGKSLIDVEFADGVSHIENPEFAEVHTDADDKILYGVKQDGDFYFGAGVPSQIQEKIAEDIANKVDKEEGKSLIDAGYASTKSTIDNPEFLDVTLDAEDKVLEGIQQDGTKVIGGDTKILGNMEVSGVSYKVIENPEYLAAWIDAEDKVIFGFKTDGKTYVGDADFLDDVESIKAFLANFNDKAIDWEALTSITATENPELIEVKTDSEGKLLAGRTFDGAAFEKVGFSTPKISIEGHTIENIEDHEGRTEILTDNEGKIISYRDSDGVKHEEVGINVNHLELTESGMTDFQQALKEAGFNPGGAGNWSDYISNDGDSPLEIAMPRCAHLNLLTDFNLVNLKKAYYNGSIKGVDYDIPIEVEFFDMQGNYFKKKAFISGQGRSTMNRDKKNIAIDFFDSDWDDDAFAIRFGDWVPQDSFHLKAYANEAFNANGTWAYKIYDAMSKSWGIEYDYLYKRALLDMSQNTSVKAYGTEPSDNAKFEDTGAKCFPDGFPVIVYQNGEFWGVFAWQLKKHRDNYKMKKSEPKHIHLDGIINTNVWDTNGAPEWWTLEVRNPKDVVYSSAHLDSVTGKYTYKYDGDLSQENIAGNQQWSSVHEYPIDYVVEWEGKRYKSLQNSNTGNEPSTASEYWSVDSETPYDLWVSGTSYPQNKVIEHNGHKFINSVADNTEEPIIDSERGINTDKAPDFKNKTGCGWINCTNTIKVKNYIIDMSRIMTKIKEKEDAYLADTSAENLQELKSTFETYFDVDNLVDYLIINDIINNADAFASNWQWLTYDGVKWWCGLYDCNISFGYGGGQYTTADFRAPLTGHAGGSSNYMMRYIKAYYKDELEARYSFLRRNKVVTAEKIVYDIIIDWTNAVGYVNYAKEREKWPGEVSVDNIYRLKKWVYETIANLDILYRYSNI